MPNYKAMYSGLYNAMTDAIALLQKAQQDAEEAYLADDAPTLRLLTKRAELGLGKTSKKEK